MMMTTEEFLEKKGWEIGYEEAFPQEDYTEEDLIELERIYNESHQENNSQGEK